MFQSNSTLLIDNPLTPDQSDLLGINTYKNALIKCLKNTDTPISIALQGEWGSGKTSLMNAIKYNLCQDKPTGTAPFYPVSINAWQFSLSSDSPTCIVINILRSAILQIGEIKANTSALNKAIYILGKIGTAAMPVIETITEEAAGVLSEAVCGNAEAGKNTEKAVVKSFKELFESKDPLILQLKDSIKELVDQTIGNNKDSSQCKRKRGFIFFIDDLDRIDPVLSVKILELFKNIFCIDNCIFLLAIDYDVIAQGLEPKFGELTPKNENKFNSYFDKLVQLSFSMPVKSYDISTFLRDSLLKIKFFNKKEDLYNNGNTKLLKEFVYYAQLSVGNNPRLLKNLINSFSVVNHILYNQITKESPSTFNAWTIQKSKTIVFALICIQTAFPQIYNLLSEVPNFIAWDKSLADDLQITITESTIPQSIQDEWIITREWEKILYVYSRNNGLSYNQTYNVIYIFRKIEELVDLDIYIDKISDYIKYTDVTCRSKSSKIYAKRPQREFAKKPKTSSEFLDSLIIRTISNQDQDME